MAGDEIEDVDFPGPTPWEQEQIRMALVTLERHGYRVVIEPPSPFGAGLSPARPTPPWGGRDAVEPNDLGKPALANLSDAELARALKASPEEVREIRAKWPVPRRPADAAGFNNTEAFGSRDEMPAGPVTLRPVAVVGAGLSFGEMARLVSALSVGPIVAMERRVPLVRTGPIRLADGTLCDCPLCVGPTVGCLCHVCTAAREGTI